MSWFSSGKRKKCHYCMHAGSFDPQDRSSTPPGGQDGTWLFCNSRRGTGGWVRLDHKCGAFADVNKDR